MDSHGTDRIEEVAVTETPEDVAVLYSWANLHGAKYRDFSASRREYRAQLRHRAAQQVREQALLAQAEAEAAAAEAEVAQRQAVEAIRNRQPDQSDSSVQRSLLEAEEAARTAAAERVEAARRAEAAALAEATARREEREIAEAHASAQRQAARYADSEIRRRTNAGQAVETSQLPGEISDPYSAHPETQVQPKSQVESMPTKPEPTHQKEAAPVEDRRSNGGPGASDRTDYSPSPIHPDQRVPAQHSTPRRPQGYRPDDASGVRQIYRGPDYDAAPTENESIRLRNSAPAAQESKSKTESSVEARQTPAAGLRSTDVPPPPMVRPVQADPAASLSTGRADYRSASTTDRPDRPDRPDSLLSPRESTADSIFAASSALRQPDNHAAAAFSSAPARAVSPFSQALVPSDSTRGRRAQDDFDYQAERDRRNASESASDSPRSSYIADPAGPAWLYAAPAPLTPQKSMAFQAPPAQSSVADTLQHSRERVAARWFALKGVFEQPGQEQPETAPVRQKETRTPVLAVFSLAGGVGKTSLVATVGRSLSSMGEKVLLTDTTSHGLLPFYFGASELRQGTVRTFSPPSGSTDAPIYLVSYDVEQTGRDDAAQDLLTEEIINNSRGTHRILLDLTPSSSWIVRRMFRMNPTILVPVAPDMNSVISLQTVEKFFHGINDGNGRPLQPFYVLNQFDTSLPLHLDVREVLRRQLGERLLPFVIRRAPAVSEALAEGMTVVDYAPDAPVAEDYLNLATWLRTVAAPATAGFRNVRWSER